MCRAGTGLLVAPTSAMVYHPAWLKFVSVVLDVFIYLSIFHITVIHLYRVID